ncbi:hypothetical protein JHK87_001508 [Glycine soja]|nr:hypothetical protein JHK87_001508 [Glycine soja]
MRLDDSSISLGLERMTECSGPISNACILHTDQVVSEKLILSTSKAGTNKTRRIKVKQNKKRCLEFSGLYLGKEVRAHKGVVWTMKFSPSGQYLVSGATIERNRSLTKEEINAYWRVKKETELEHLRAMSKLSETIQARKFEDSKNSHKSSTVTLASIKESLGMDVDQKSLEQLIKKNGWWTKSSWAFLNGLLVIEAASNKDAKIPTDFKERILNWFDFVVKESV